MPNIDWTYVVERGAAIVEQYDTSVTLRQLFYRLVSEQAIPNSDNAYKGLSRYTARARRDGDFPDLIDPGRKIYRHRTFDSPREAMTWLQKIYLRKRDAYQEHSIYIGVEKLGLAEQLNAWFSGLGIAIVVLRGYPSQSYVDQIVEDVGKQGRPAVFIYAGDFDPSGEDIERDFLARTDCWESTERIALTPQQIQDYNLPPLPGKKSDSRSGAFEAKHGVLMQVELDALAPEDLRRLYTDALGPWWDGDEFDRAIEEEAADDATLAHLTALDPEDVVISKADAQEIVETGELPESAVNDIEQQLPEEDDDGAS